MSNPASPDAPKPAAIDPAVMLDTWLKEILSCTVRGAVASLPRVKVEMVLISVCRATGSIMGRLYGGDELAVARFRKACRDAFKEGIKSEPVVGLPKAAPAADTAVPKAAGQ